MGGAWGPTGWVQDQVGLSRSRRLPEIGRRTHLPNGSRLALPHPAYHSPSWLGSERESAGITRTSLPVCQSVSRSNVESVGLEGGLSGRALS